MSCNQQIQGKEKLPLSRRLRINIAGNRSSVHAPPHGAARSSPSAPAFIVFLNWSGESAALTVEQHLGTEIKPSFPSSCVQHSVRDCLM